MRAHRDLVIPSYCIFWAIMTFNPGGFSISGSLTYLIRITLRVI